MLASEFITARERFCKAVSRGLITHDYFHQEMHTLFKRAQVSKGFTDDCEKADMILHNMKHPEDKWL